MRTDRGVALRPTAYCSVTVLGPGSLNIPSTDAEWMVERGPGGGGRFGSQDGYPSDDESGGGDSGEDERSVPAWVCPALRSNSTGDELCRDEDRFGVVGDSSCVRNISVSNQGHARA